MSALRSIILLLLIIAGTPTYCNEIPDPMNPPRLVNDFSNLLTSSEFNSLERKLRNYYDTTSTQIYVVIVDDLTGYDISDYAQRLGQKWGIGQKGKDNGAVILIKPKNGRTKGQAFIATGYGLEENVPDALARQIVDNEMIPLFAQNKYAQGINRGLNVMIGLISGKYTTDSYSRKKSNSSNTGAIIIALIIGIALISSGFKRSGSTGKLTYKADIPLMILLSLLSNRGGGGGGGFGNFSSGSGGFSGGGGGSFGGGGAGGSW